MDKAIEFDYVVVGAGSAGCALAARLSANGVTTVALLEAEGPDKSVLIHAPAGVKDTLLSDDLKVDANKIDLMRFFSSIDKAPGNFAIVSK